MRNVIHWTPRSLILMGWLALVAGCDRAWQAYQGVELGGPLPVSGLLARDGATENGVTIWSDAATISLPLIFGRHELSVASDENGRVVAKAYHAFAAGHWLLAQTFAVRMILEVQIPEALFREPGSAAIQSDDIQFDQQHTPRDAVEFLRFAEHRTSSGFSKVESLPAENSVAFKFVFMLCMVSDDRPLVIRDVLQHPDALAGITRTGFDRTLTNRWGATCRIRNLGGRRIRIESKFLGVFDPFFLVAMMRQ